MKHLECRKQHLWCLFGVYWCLLDVYWVFIGCLLGVYWCLFVFITSCCSNKGVVCAPPEKTQAAKQCIIEAQTAMSMEDIGVQERRLHDPPAPDSSRWGSRYGDLGLLAAQFKTQYEYGL